MSSTEMRNRRHFIRFASGAALATASLSSPAKLLAATSAVVAKDSRQLRFHNIHTNQNLEVVYRVDDEYIQENLMRINYLLRDHRQNEAIIMDHALFDQLWLLQQRIGGNRVFDIISGYRSPQTNEMLRRKSPSVAKNSYHMQGRAVDIRLRGASIKSIRNAALSIKAGGVGYYPNSKFVHLDTGPVRDWTSV